MSLTDEDCESENKQGGLINMDGRFGCNQCQCTPEDTYCSCACHDLNGDNKTNKED